MAGFYDNAGINPWDLMRLAQLSSQTPQGQPQQGQPGAVPQQPQQAPPGQGGDPWSHVGNLNSRDWLSLLLQIMRARSTR